MILSLFLSAEALFFRGHYQVIIFELRDKNRRGLYLFAFFSDEFDGLRDLVLMLFDKICCDEACSNIITRHAVD